MEIEFRVLYSFGVFCRKPTQDPNMDFELTFLNSVSLVNHRLTRSVELSTGLSSFGPVKIFQTSHLWGHNRFGKFTGQSGLWGGARLPVCFRIQKASLPIEEFGFQAEFSKELLALLGCSRLFSLGESTRTERTVR